MFLRSGRFWPVPVSPSGTVLVAGSRGSGVLWMIALSTVAASATVLAWGPTVSWVWLIGTTPARLTSPTVGLMPTTPLLLAGQTMLPSVSVPIETLVRLPLVAAPEPELDPHGFHSIAYGLWHWPPRPDQPLDEWNDRKLAHSLRFVLPRITAPALRRLAATVESLSAGVPTRAKLPAAVCSLSWVSILSFNSTGIPCIAPTIVPDCRSMSCWRAIDGASGLTWRIELSVGPLWSRELMRASYMFTMDTELRLPPLIPA